MVLLLYERGRHSTGSLILEDGHDTSTAEDTSILTVDDDNEAPDIQTTAAIVDSEQPSENQIEHYSPKAYLQSPTASMLRVAAVSGNACASPRNTSPPSDKVLSSGPAPSLSKRAAFSRSRSSPTVNSTTPGACSKSACLSNDQPQDVMWLLRTLQSEGNACRDEKRKAISELKRLAKAAPEEYWRRNCAQVSEKFL